MFEVIMSAIILAFCVAAAVFVVFILSRLVTAIALHAKNQENMIQLLGEIRDSLVRNEPRGT